MCIKVIVKVGFWVGSGDVAVNKKEEHNMCTMHSLSLVQSIHPLFSHHVTLSDTFFFY